MIEELFKNSGLAINGLIEKSGRGRNPVNEYIFLFSADDVEMARSKVMAALEGSPLRLAATVLVSDGVFECTVLGVADPRG